MSKDDNATFPIDSLDTGSNQHDVRKRLFRDIFLGAVVLGCFAVFMTWSDPLVAIAGVLITVSFAWISEYMLTRKKKWIAKGHSVLVTGCDTGFGNMLALHLDNLGVIVFAGCLNSGGEGALKLKDEGSSRIHVLQMDVTNDNQVQECLSYVEKSTKGKGLYGLVNNAGLNFLGDVELNTIDQFIKVANVNQIGMIRVTKSFLPLIRKMQGRIVNITSVKGLIAEPFNAAYTMTKYAGEAFSDILRMEMKKFGVSVSVIEPGNFGGATGCLDMKRIGKDFETMYDNMSDELRSVYPRSYIDLHLETAKATIPTAGRNLIDVMDAIADALFSSKPHQRYLVPGSNRWYELYRWRIFVQRFLPTDFMDCWLLQDWAPFTTHRSDWTSHQ